jgi:8-oxo-dGTP diphosphatase/2-hydroxy-dATP diphosphatase
MSIKKKLDESLKRNMAKRRILTVSFLLSEDQILLAMKKRGFGAGRWNGYGGNMKEEDGGDVIKCAKREILEEAEMEVETLEEIGILGFYFKNKPGEEIECHVFKIIKSKGEPKETEEMRPQQFRRNEIPYDKMWSADNLWLPLFLDGKKFRGWFLYDSPEGNNILKYELEEV